MNGTDNLYNSYYYTLFIGLSWDADASVNAGSAVFVTMDNTYYSGTGSYDALTGWNVGNGGSSSFPEPSTILLLGSGLFGFAGIAGKRMKK